MLTLRGHFGNLALALRRRGEYVSRRGIGPLPNVPILVCLEPAVRILVPLKRVADPDQADAVRLADEGARLDVTGLEAKPNPFDQYALEAALRLTEDGAHPKERRGEVVVVTLGPPDTELRLRNALATGADRAIRVDATDDDLDGRLVARALQTLVEEVKPDLVLMGKQAVDGDTNQVGQLLAEGLDWPMATFAATLIEEASGTLRVEREVDGGTVTVRLHPPAVVTVDLRIVGARSVRSRHTDAAHEYGAGVRFAPLLAIRQAQRKPLMVRPLATVVANSRLATRYVRYALAPRRPPGVRLGSVTELVDRLANEAKVLPP